MSNCLNNPIYKSISFIIEHNILKGGAANFSSCEVLKLFNMYYVKPTNISLLLYQYKRKIYKMKSSLVLLLRFEQKLMEKIEFKVTFEEIRCSTLQYVVVVQQSISLLTLGLVTAKDHQQVQLQRAVLNAELPGLFGTVIEIKIWPSIDTEMTA